MKLNPGDKVGIISPSSFLRNREAVELGLDYLRSLKLEPVLGEHVFDAFRYTGRIHHHLQGALFFETPFPPGRRGSDGPSIPDPDRLRFRLQQLYLVRGHHPREP